jgi:hypothetical protein
VYRQKTDDRLFSGLHFFAGLSAPEVEVLTDITSHRDPGEIIQLGFQTEKRVPAHAPYTRETWPELQRRETLRRARGRSKPAGEEEQVFHWWVLCLEVGTFQFKNPYRFIDTDLATMLQAAALGCGPCQDKIVETRSVSFLKFSNPKKRNEQGKTFRLGLYYEIKNQLHQPWKG